MRGWIVSAIVLLFFTVRGVNAQSGFEAQIRGTSELSELLARVIGDKLVVHVPAFTRSIVVWRE